MAVWKRVAFFAGQMCCYSVKNEKQYGVIGGSAAAGLKATVAHKEFMAQAKKIRVLLLDGQDDCLAILAVRCLQRTGRFDVHCITDVATHRLRYSMRCKVLHDTLDTPANLLESVKRYIMKIPVDVILPLQEGMIAMAGEVAVELNKLARLAPAPDPDLCDRVDNKWRFHELMVSASIKVPRCVHAAGDRAMIEEELKTWRGPFLFKPVYGNGGYGILKYDSIEDAIHALDALPGEQRGDTVIQEYVPGRDMGCGLLGKDGEVVAHSIFNVSLTQNRAYTCGLGHEFIHDEAISAMLETFARVSRWSGVANFDLRVDERDGTVYVLEVNPRYWQTMLGSLYMGINFPEIHCRLALGQQVGPYRSRTGFWVNYHALSQDVVNLKRVIASKDHALRAVHFSEFFADPLLESIYIVGGIQRYLNAKLAQRRTRVKQRRKAS